MNKASKTEAPAWGILGGMGPLASAEFLASIYKFSLGRPEQNMPTLYLMSDPKVPDRTKAILTGEYGNVVRSLERLLKKLWSIQVDHIVVPCITAHFFFPYLNLPEKITSRVISLVDVIYESLLADHRRYILLCTSGTRKARIFQSDRRWKEVCRRKSVILPNSTDQDKIHKYLYDVKQTWGLGDIGLLKALEKKYEADGFIAGCTEVHLYVKQLISNGIQVIDPLTILARRIADSSFDQSVQWSRIPDGDDSFASTRRQELKVDEVIAASQGKSHKSSIPFHLQRDAQMLVTEIATERRNRAR
jgi:aspartate racemase